MESIVAGITKSDSNGIEVAFAQKMVVDSNFIVNIAGYGIVLHSSSNRSTVRRNKVRHCGMMGLRIRGADNNDVTDNTISWCRTGIHAGLGSNRNRLIHNRAANNAVVDLSDSSADPMFGKAILETVTTPAPKRSRLRYHSSSGG